MQNLSEPENDKDSWLFDLPVEYGGKNPEIEKEKVVEEKAVEVAPKKKKLNKADFMFKSIKDETLVKNPGDINGIDFMIKDLENCTVILLDHTAQI